MKKAMTAILITTLIFHLSCVPLHVNIKKEKILFKCEAIYKTGNLAIKVGKKGRIFLLEKQLLFGSKSGKEIYEEIPYDKIKSFQPEEEIKKLLFQRSSPLYAKYRRGSILEYMPSFWEALLNSLLIVAVVATGYFLIKSLEDYVYVKFEIENNSDIKWGIFKIEKGSFLVMSRIIKERCKLG